MQRTFRRKIRKGEESHWYAYPPRRANVGLEALDFIQLLYKPPFPLDAVITSSILEKYDRIFLFLLRLFRMQYVASQLFRDAASRTSFAQGTDPLAQRFRIEAHHFITTIAGYIFHVSIG